MDEEKNGRGKIQSRQSSIVKDESPVREERSHRHERHNRHEACDRNSRKTDEKLNEELKKYKLKYEKIQTELTKTEIQMYDYKVKLNKNESLRTNLDTKIAILEASLAERNREYSYLRDEYDRLRLTDQSNKLNKLSKELNESSKELNESSKELNESSKELNESSKEHYESSNDLSKLHYETSLSETSNEINQKTNLNLNKLIETNRQLAQLNEQLKNEIENLQTELEESNDRYREEQENEFKEMKYKLENCVRNSRLLQFKLTKLERAYNQLKVENHHLANKLKKATELGNLRNRPLTPQTEITRTELDRAKEVLLRMHVSLQTEKGEKMRLESTVKRLEEQLNLTKSELLSISLRNQNHQFKSAHPSRALSPQTSADRQLEEQVRDLEERESDLQEQLKFSEQESNSLRAKLSTIEQENELLTRQLQTLCGKSDKSNDDQSIENMVVMKVEQDEQLAQLKNELEEQKKQNQELERKLNWLTHEHKDDELIDSREFIKRGSGELIRKGSGEIIRRDSGASDLVRRDSIGKQEGDDHRLASISHTSLGAPNAKVEKVLQKEMIISGSLFYEEKIENLERQLAILKNDLNEKQQENENLINLIDLRKKDKLSKRFALTRSSSLQD